MPIGAGLDRLERVLYVTEPVAGVVEAAAGTQHRAPYSEYEALTGYVQHLAQRGDPRVRLRVRTHPSEAPDKYEALLGEYAGTVELRPAPGATLVQDVVWADTVVGCNTMAMVAALAAGRRVISALPRGWPLTLPFAEIERLFD